MNTDRYRDLLLKERAQVFTAIQHLHDSTTGSIEDETGEEAYHDHLADSATATLSREIDHTLGENSEHVLMAIDEALVRLESGTFGTCGRCGKPIADERLEAIPYVNRCIDCKRLEERG
ncbi:MAG TPA: TraR/DksA C4-type zinc finger protein [Gaiellaceae bacterium]|nr:TraR/DksA C4-type zinc finger protein [Gaiellaceae bacterium]